MKFDNNKNESPRSLRKLMINYDGKLINSNIFDII